LFIPEEGHTWGCFDYSQQEPSLVTHYASLDGLYGVSEVLDAYNDEPDTDFHRIVADMANIPRIKLRQLTLVCFMVWVKINYKQSLVYLKKMLKIYLEIS